MTAERTLALPPAAARVFVSESILSLSASDPPAEIIPFEPKSDQEKTQFEPVLQVTDASVPIAAFEELSNLTSALLKEDETRLPEKVIFKVVRAMPPEADADKFRIARSSTLVLTRFVVAPSGVAENDLATGEGSAGVLVAGAGFTGVIGADWVGACGIVVVPEPLI